MKIIDLKSAVRIALCSALISVCAWISVPTAVPFTLQTFAVFTSVGILGTNRGCFAVLIYILMGSLGLPVFSGGRGGLGTVFGPTGGFLVGFLPMAFVSGKLWTTTKKRPCMLLVAMAVGLLVCYGCGILWYAFVYLKGGNAAVKTAIGQCVAPFIIPDILKMLLALIVVKRLKKHLNLF